MKTKIWVGVLFYSFMGCANKAPKSNLTSKSIPKEPEGYGVRYIPVYLQLIISQYFISNKSGIWSLSLIVHSKG